MHVILKPFILRRRKQLELRDLLPQLDQREEDIEWPEQAQSMQYWESIKKLDHRTELLRKRQLVCHWALVPTVDSGALEVDTDKETLKERREREEREWKARLATLAQPGKFESSARLDASVQLWRSFLEEQDKNLPIRTIIFSEWKRLLQLAILRFEQEAEPPLMFFYHGDLSTPDKENAIKAFTAVATLYNS